MIRSSGGHGSTRGDWRSLVMGAARRQAARLCPGATASRARHRVGSVVRQDQRGPFLTALERARAAAFPAGDYVGQESFMRACEVRTLAHPAGGGRGVSVLDLCCGVAGPGRMITAESGCPYPGADHSAPPLAIAPR